MGTKYSWMVVAFLLFLMGCADDASDEIDLLESFDFAIDNQQWNGGISDYPERYEDSLDFYLSRDFEENKYGMDHGNSGLNSGLNISSYNPHGDLFYYFIRKVIDLKPETIYYLDFEFLVYALVTDEIDDLSSFDLFLKMGAVNFQPQLEQVPWPDQVIYKILNIDKGHANQDEGKDLINVGSIKEFTDKEPNIITGNTFDRNYQVKTNSDGHLWILIGVDSGIRNHLTFGMEALNLYYREKK